jgi:hypothetical protein
MIDRKCSSCGSVMKAYPSKPVGTLIGEQVVHHQVDQLQRFQCTNAGCTHIWWVINPATGELESWQL